MSEGDICRIYGLRAKDSNQFFYVGSTKRDLEWRLSKHRNHVASGLHRNQRFTEVFNQISADNVVIELIEEINQDQRFQREAYWIKTLPNLVNLVKNPDGEKRLDGAGDAPLDWSDNDGTVLRSQIEHSANIRLSANFAWNDQRSRAAVLLASGATRNEVATECGVNRQTIFNWLHHPDFSAEIDRLSLMIGIASRAERLRLAMRVLKSKMKDGVLQSDKDALEWLKFAQSETDGVKLDLTKLAALAQNEAPVADSGSAARTGTTEGTGESAESVN
jgi:predicted GIY-YIG superfamily endonuclease/predicted transcriptional regulator